MMRYRDSRDDNVQKCCHTIGIEKYTNFLHTQKQTGDFYPHPLFNNQTHIQLNTTRERKQE